MATSVTFARGTDASGAIGTTKGLITFNIANNSISIGDGSTAHTFYGCGRATKIFERNGISTISTTQNTANVDGEVTWTNTGTYTLNIPGIVLSFENLSCTSPNSNYNFGNLTHSFKVSTSTFATTLTIKATCTTALGAISSAAPRFSFDLVYLPMATS